MALHTNTATQQYLKLLVSLGIGWVIVLPSSMKSSCLGKSFVDVIDAVQSGSILWGPRGFRSTRIALGDLVAPASPCRFIV